MIKPDSFREKNPFKETLFHFRPAKILITQADKSIILCYISFIINVIRPWIK